MQLPQAMIDNITAIFFSISVIIHFKKNAVGEAHGVLKENKKTQVDFTSW
jgi:hypothetical protein